MSLERIDHLFQNRSRSNYPAIMVSAMIEKEIKESLDQTVKVVVKDKTVKLICQSQAQRYALNLKKALLKELIAKRANWTNRLLIR